MGCSGNIFGDPLYYGEEQLNVSAITDNSYLQAALDAIPDQYVDDGRVRTYSFFFVTPTEVSLPGPKPLPRLGRRDGLPGLGRC